MDFYKNIKHLQLARYIVLTGAIIYFVCGCYDDYLHHQISYSRIALGILLIVSMSCQIIECKRRSKADTDS